jgi:hypothetical protein
MLLWRLLSALCNKSQFAHTAHDVKFRLYACGALQELGAIVQQQRSGYVYATWSTSGPAGSGGLVDLEFLFADNDNTVSRAVMQNRWQ